MSSNFLYVNVKIKNEKHRFGVWLPPIALFVLRDIIVSFDGYLGLVPGRAGVQVRKGADSLQTAVYAMTQSELDVNYDSRTVKVRVRTL